jgi:hypothetical protein
MQNESNFSKIRLVGLKPNDALSTDPGPFHEKTGIRPGW